MKPQELRIGNYVKYNQHVLKIKAINSHKVKGWQDGYITSVDQEGKSKTAIWALSPIKITKEWLLDFGFEKIVFDSEETGYGENYVLNLNSKTKIVFEDDMSFGIENSLIDTHWLELEFDKFEGVHELQNLYYALTKKELSKRKR